MDKLDQLLSLGSTPDWISPLSALIEDLFNGPQHRFYIDRNCGYSVNDIKRLLKSYGVHVWGDIIIDDMIVLTVRQAQARWAQYLLQRAGVPILGRALGAPETRVMNNTFQAETLVIIKVESGLVRLVRWLAGKWLNSPKP